MRQFIYFDRDDEDADGFGWNVVDSGECIAARFATLDDARAFCDRHGFDYDESTTARDVDVSDES